MPEQHTQPTARRGRGRPTKEEPQKHTLVSVTLSPESRQYLERIKNKSGFIEQLIVSYRHQSYLTCFKFSPETIQYLESQENQTKYIEQLIKKDWIINHLLNATT